MNAPNKAVFLSYASQDAEVVRRIADALRAAGVEVWFDQNELVGGDAWDAKIRKQIKECALFVPVISANTQARREGYFRIEWKLAAQRTHAIAEGTPFLLPLVIDETRDGEALVPSEFREVQWTRLPVRQAQGLQPGGEVTAAFVARVKRLLESGVAQASSPALRSDAGGTPALRPDAAPRRRWVVPAIFGVAAIGALAIWQPWKTGSLPAPATTPAIASPTAPLSESRQLTLRARALIDDDLMAVRENFRLADELCQRATALDNTDAEAWATWARVSAELVGRAYDTTPQRRESARGQAERAIRLAPNSVEAGLAMATYLQVTGESAEAERRLRALLSRAPLDVRVALVLSEALQTLGKDADASEIRLRHPAFAGKDSRPLVAEARELRRNEEYLAAEALLDQAQALAPTPRGYVNKFVLLGFELGDLDAARRYLEIVPSSLLLDDAFASNAARFWLRLGQGDKTLELLRRVPRDFFEENQQFLPKGYLMGWGLRVTGRPAAAEAEWKQALVVVTKRLAAEPNQPELLRWKALLLALTGQIAAGEEAHRLYLELSVQPTAQREVYNVRFLLAAGRNEAAVAALHAAWVAAAANGRGRTAFLAHGLRYDPWFEPIRKDPRVQEIIAAGDAWLKEMRRAGATSAGGKSAATGAPAAPVAPVAPAPDPKSVAVLPFANHSAEKEGDYFSDGLTEGILNALARERDLQVPGRASSFSFKNKGATTPEIARALHVAQVIEGSVRKAGNLVRIDVTLTRASDGFRVSESLGKFERELTNGAVIFALQDEVAQAVVKKLTQRSAVTAPVAVLTENPDAYDAYLRGRALQTRAAGFRYQAAAEYERAVAADPQFALAWARLAEARFRDYRAFFDWRPAIVESTWSALSRALAAQPDLPEALIVRGGWYRLVKYDYAAAQKDFERAEALQPATAGLRHAQGLLALDRGDIATAKRLLREAMHLDPENGDQANSIANTLGGLGEMQIADELYARAMRIQGADQIIPLWNRAQLRARWRGPEAALRLIERAPPGQRGLDELAADLLLHLGRREDALLRARRIPLERFSSDDLAVFQDAEPVASILTAAGDAGRARALWEKLRLLGLKETAAGDLAPRVRKSLARAEAALGNRAAAVAVLEAWSRELASMPSVDRRTTEFSRLAATCYMEVGMPEEALKLLQEIERGTFTFGMTLRTISEFKALHGDRRFEDLVTRAEARAKAHPDPVEP